MLRAPENPHGVDFGAFNPLSYQFLFIIGLAFGTSQVNLGRLPAIARKWLIGSCGVVAAAFFALRQDYAFHGPFENLLYRLREWLGAVELGPLRVLSFAAFAVILYSILQQGRMEEGPLERVLLAGLRRPPFPPGLCVVDLGNLRGRRVLSLPDR